MAPDLVIAGAGMAGLVAAAHARGRGARVLVLEKAGRPGGAALLSSGVVWRHHTLAAFRADCPGGDPALQGLLLHRLDADLDWLEGLGAPVAERGTGNPRTTGRRFDAAGMIAALAARAGDVRLGTPLHALPRAVPVVLATGGFAASRPMLRRHVTPRAADLALRSPGGATGDGIRLALGAGAALSAGMDEVYGRAMPAPPARLRPDRLVPLAQLYARHARVCSLAGQEYAARTWSEVDVVQWMARQPGARARFLVPDDRLPCPVGRRTVGEMVQAARRAGAPVRRVGRGTEVEVVAGVTTTLGGLAADPRGQVADGLFAAGQDVGGMATGGYASGLAAALVLGRVAADAALAAP